MNRRNKKGFELALSTLVYIILALLVLAIMIFIVTGGFKKFQDYLNNVSPSEVQSVKSACRVACEGHQDYDFCTRERDVKSMGKINCTDYRINVTCGNFIC